MNKIFEALQKEHKSITEANNKKYTVVANYVDHLEEVEFFDDLRDAMTYVFDSNFAAQMSADSCYSLSINNATTTIFEIYYDGATKIDEYKGASEDELRVIDQFLNDGNKQTVSVAFDIEINADLSESDIEQLVRKAMKNAGAEISSYVEIHSQD